MRYVAFLRRTARRVAGRTIRPLRRHRRERQAAARRVDAAQEHERWQQREPGSEDLERPASFVLYRIIGNDLPPRHRDGQNVDNLRFLLEHEPDLPGCEKRFVVNRIIDPDVERRLLDLLEEHGSTVVNLPFRVEEYQQLGWRVADFTRSGMFYGRAYDGMPKVVRARAIDHAYHDKNLYVMNNNGARNAALEDGQTQATWILPFDGNCFFTTTAWEDLRAAVLDKPHIPYVLVPMARINDNRELLDPAFQPEPNEEPQIAFRADARERFDDRQRYGRRSKVSLLRRLGVPGPWDSWGNEEWEASWPEPSPEAGCYQHAGWVARLTSGNPHLETDERERMLTRMEAIRRCLSQADEQVLRRRFDAADLHTRSEAILEAQRSIVSTDDGFGALLTVRNELHRARSGSRTSPAGFGAIAREAVEDSLSGWLLGDERLLARAATSIETTFVNPRSRLSPTLLRGGAWLLRDLDQVLDAVRLTARAHLLADGAYDAVVDWVAAHRAWLQRSRRGTRARRSLGPAGTWYEVQLAACHAFLDEAAELTELSRRVAARRHDQFGAASHRSRSVRRHPGVTGPANLHGWLRLLSVTERLGLALEPQGSAGERGLRTALDHHLRHLPPANAQLLRAALGSAGVDQPVSADQIRRIDLPDGPGLPPRWWVGTVAVRATD